MQKLYQYEVMLKCVSILLFLFFSIKNSNAQHESDNWYFGEHAGVSFSAGKPVVLYNNQMKIIGNTPTEGVASISDKSGHLLFYTNGVTVWNSQQRVILNGTDLNGNTHSTQSAIIVPSPGNDSLYYIFTADFFTGTKGLCYSIVNMNRNNGLGEVVKKNIWLLSSNCEKITAVKHCNNRDIWVITRKYNSPDYYAYLITDKGVSPPVISNAGNIITEDYQKRGYLKISHDGRKLASIYGASAEFSDFIRSTGKVNSTQLLYIPSLNLDTAFPNGMIGYGIEFSPDDRFMYISWESVIPPINITDYISQFDISSNDLGAIKASQYNVASSNISDSDFRLYEAMQLASDGKIYVATMYDLASINNPGTAGIDCNFQKHSVDLSPGASGFGLPTFLQSYLFDPLTITNDCQFQTIYFSLGNSSQYDSSKWDFSDAASGQSNFSASFSPTHIFSTKGTYTVTCFLYGRSSCVDTVIKEVVIKPLADLGNDTTICEKDTLRLHVNVPGVSNYWSDGSVDTAFKIFQQGKYWIDLLSGSCKTSDTINVAIQSLPVVNLGNDTSLCDNALLLLEAKNSGSSYLWQDNSIHETFTVNRSGTYSVKVMNNGCSSVDTIKTIYNYRPFFNLGKEAFYCEKQKLELTPNYTDASYKWQDGSTLPVYIVNKTGLYYVTASNQCGSFTDSINIKPGYCHVIVPGAFTPNSDGLNDIFKALEIELVTEFEMKIYNRWGQLMFETKDKMSGWNGRNLGQLMQAGSYVYVIAYKEQGFVENKFLKGLVTLIR